MGWHIVDGPQVGHWVAKQTEGAYFAEKSQAIGLNRDGETVAGVIYENWNGRSIVCHIAFLGRLTPLFLYTVFKYPFITCNVLKIIAPITSTNDKALKVVQKMGFVEEARITNAGPTGDIVFMTLARESCRFLGGRYG
jgi:hypothetical protein